MRLAVEVKAELGDLSLDVAFESDGPPTFVLGENGAGKSTLFRVLAGALRPREGFLRLGDRVLLDRRPIGSSFSRHNAPPCVDAAPQKRRVGYVPQRASLFSHMNGLDNAAFGLTIAGLPRSAARRQARVLLEQLEVDRVAMKFPGEMSGGEQQRVAIARALLPSTDLLLLDEPLAAQDASIRPRIRDILSRVVAQHPGVAVLSTHDVRDVAFFEEQLVAVNAVVLERGRVVQRASPSRVATAPCSAFAREFFFGYRAQ